MKKLIRLAVGMSCVVALSGAPPARGSERSWLQWGGPDRNFHLELASLATAWPDGGPVQVWSRPLGEGYSAILVDGSVLYTMYRDGDDEVIVALDTETGETRWRHAYRAPFPDSSVYDYWRSQAGPGPYSTPLLSLIHI